MQYDYALVVLAEPIGRRVGWMQVGGGCNDAGSGAGGEDKPTTTGGDVKQGKGAPDDGGGASGRALKEVGIWGLGRPATVPKTRRQLQQGPQQQVQAQALVTVAGYPDDKENGTLWAETCTLDLGAGAENGGGSSSNSQGLVGGDAQAGAGPPPLRTHNCHTRGGNSGSPLWVQVRAGNGMWRGVRYLIAVAERGGGMEETDPTQKLANFECTASSSRYSGIAGMHTAAYGCGAFTRATAVMRAHITPATRAPYKSYTEG